MIGEKIYQYEILEKLGSGGMGEVYLAEDTKLNRQVALKFLPVHLSSDETLKTRFISEARAAAKLNHPNIITIFEVGEYNGRTFFAMEYVEGKPLTDIIDKHGVPSDQAIDITLQICEGLKEAHKIGIVHRDIKPSNIIVDEGGRCRILDFGLAAVQSEERLTKTGSLLGTIEYMSPEQVRGEKVDHRSDIFSLGVLLYEMLTGQLPFKGEYAAGVVYSVINEPPELLDKHKLDISEDFQVIIDRALEKDPDMRYQDIDGFLIDINKLKSGLELFSAETRQPSIAVLPFRDMSAQMDQEYFCDGISEEIINALTHIESLHVVARTSAFSFKGKDIDIREVGRKLGVGTILEGSVRKADGRLRITAQLINVSDGYHLWSERYESEMEDVFAIQDEITATIVDRLKLKLLGKDKARLEKHYTSNLEAYNLYMKGNYFLSKRSGEGLRKALENYKQAIEIDTNYASAYTGHANCYILLPFYSDGGWLPKMAYEKARLSALKALDIDIMLAEAHNSLAAVLRWYDWDLPKAEHEFKQAIDLNPNFAMAHHWYGNFLAVLGRFKEAIFETKNALKLDPLSLIINTNFGDILYYKRDFEEAMRQYQMTLEMDPEFKYAHLMLGRVFLQKGLFDEAIYEFKKSGGPEIIYAFEASGMREEARGVFENVKKKYDHRQTTSLSLANAYLGLKEIDKAFETLEIAYQERWPRLFDDLYIDPFYNDIRSDPRCIRLLHKMGFD